MKRPKTPKNGEPSLIEPRSTGGIHAGTGFRVQERYIAIRVAQWLAHPEFESFQAERSEDVDASFTGGAREYHQVKDEALTPGKVKAIIDEFVERNSNLIKDGKVRRFVIACGSLNKLVRSLAKTLPIFRSRDFTHDKAVEAKTLAEFNSRLRALKLEGHSEFIEQILDFQQDVLGLEREDAHDRVAVVLARTLGINDLGEAAYVAHELVRVLHDEPLRAWTKDEMLRHLRATREAYRLGPPRPAGDLIVVCHQTLKRMQHRPEAQDAPLLFEGRRARYVEIDHTRQFSEEGPPAAEGAVADLVREDGPFKAALAAGSVLYAGFPHIPLAALAGFVAQTERHVHLVEHDLDNGRFRWKPDAPSTGMQVTTTKNAAGDVARLRVSVSATVAADQCEAVLPASRVRMDLAFEADDLGRGTVGTEAQARAYASVIRRALDKHVAGRREFEEIHVFAAVPVSVAFLLGQILSGTGLPRAVVYNFNASATPSYHWSLCLHAARAREACIGIFEEQK